MDINLTGFFWGWPFNLTGQAEGQQCWPGVNINLSELNLFNFSGQATVNFTLFSIIAVISITVIIYITLIKSITKIAPKYSKMLFDEHSNKQDKLSIYGRLCGQRTLTYNYNRSYWNSLIKENYGDGGIDNREYLVEKIIISNKNLLELIGMALVLFPGAVKKSVDDYSEKTKDILWIRKRRINIKEEISINYQDMYKTKLQDIQSSSDHFEKEDNKLPELKTAINELDKDIGEILISMQSQIIQLDNEKSKPKHKWPFGRE